MQTCLIIGAGIAGAQVATSMRREGFKGSIKLIGEEPFAPYERPTLSKFFLTAEDEVKLVSCFEDTHYEEAQIELVLGKKVQAVDTTAHQVILENGEMLNYSILIFATGSRACQLCIPGAEVIHTLRNAHDAQRLRPLLRYGQKVICTGAGVIGLELASSARKLGCEVTVLEYGRTVMARSLPYDLAAIVQNIHTEYGIIFHFETELIQIDRGELLIKNGDTIEGDVFVAGVGAVRNTELAKEAGITVETGILVDEFGRTNVPSVYAVGEVAEYYSPRLGKYLTSENWHHAQRHADSVGAGISGKALPYDEASRFWTDQHSIKIQVLGTAEHCAKTIFRGDPASKSFSVFQFDENNVPVGVIGFAASHDVIGGGRLVERALPVDSSLVKNVSVPLKSILKQQTF